MLAHRFSLVSLPLLLLASLLGGCSSQADVRGLTLDQAWSVVGEVLGRRGEVVLARPLEHKLRIRHSRYYPNDLLVEEQVGPRYADSFGRVADYVEVQLRERSAAVRVDVRAWTEYRAFARQFDTDRNAELEEAVLEHLVDDLRHRRTRLQSAAALQVGRKAAAVDPPDGMVLIPAGAFVLGSEDGHSDEQPERFVELGAYYIDETEVTVGAYKRFMAAGGYRTQRYWSPEGWAWRLTYGITAPREWKPTYRDELPVIGVSWYEADAFARWAGKQLPTEAQWEKAARLDCRSRYPWGNTWIRAVNCLAQATQDGPRYGPVEVRYFPANVSLAGCVQMAGNAAEWCRDWYAEDAYAAAADRDPAGPPAGRYKVLRGGSFFSRPDEVRTTYRDRAAPGEQAVAYGFRCVREVGVVAQGQE